ncbi:hypothetical protein HWV62_25876, partial [Athelia sp. TMB]
MPDPTSQSNYLQVASEHIQLDWNVDYETRVISGFATHTMNVKEDGVEDIILDTLGLEVDSTEVDGKPAKHQLYPKHEVMGSALHIVPPSTIKSGSKIIVKIVYKTTADSTALQWLEKEPRVKNSPIFLASASQSTPAHWYPAKVYTPSVKIKYSANVTSVLPVLLSAVRQSPPSDGPPHDGKEIGKDAVTYVYDQVAMSDTVLSQKLKANHGLAAEDTGRFLAKEEEVVVPYKFGVYDML